MFQEAALIAASCVLFVQMGLSEEVQGLLHINVRFFSCPKCLTFWSVLAWALLSGKGLVHSVAASFFFSYAAMWAALVMDGLAVLYNYLYEQITQTPDTSEDAERPESPADLQDGGDEVS